MDEIIRFLMYAILGIITAVVTYFVIKDWRYPDNITKLVFILWTVMLSVVLWPILWIGLIGRWMTPIIK